MIFVNAKIFCKLDNICGSLIFTNAKIKLSQNDDATLSKPKHLQLSTNFIFAKRFVCKVLNKLNCHKVVTMDFINAKT